MASSIAAMTMPRSIDFSRATASAICSSSSLLALTAAMALVSFSGIDVASPQAFCGQTMFLGVFRGALANARGRQFWLRLVALGRVALLRMRRWRRLKPEFLPQLALGGLAAPHRFGDQLVGQNQPGVGDVLHDKRDIGIFARAYVIAM